MFINYIKVPFITFYEVYPYTDTSALGIIISGNYQVIPSANDNFDTYPTGGGAFSQLFFSGSGNWFGSGYTSKTTVIFEETFSVYQTGAISGYNGMIESNGFNSGITNSGYSQFTGLFTGYTVWSGYL